MLSRFSGGLLAASLFRCCRVSEAAKTPAATSSVCSRLLSPNLESRPAHLSDIPLRAHEQLAVGRLTCLIRQQGPILVYWQLCFLVCFNELHEGSPACIRAAIIAPVETFRPRL